MVTIWLHPPAPSVVDLVRVQDWISFGAPLKHPIVSKLIASEPVGLLAITDAV